MSLESQTTQEGPVSGSRRPPFFFRDEYSNLIVRGNFKYTLPLSTQEFKVPVTASHYYDPDVEKKKKPAALMGL